MTMREFMNEVIAAGISADATEFAEAYVGKLDATNEKRREKASEKAQINQANFARLLEVLNEKPQTATQLVGVLEGVIVRADEKALTPQYIARLAKIGVDNGSIVKESVKVEGAKGAKVGYRLA